MRTPTWLSFQAITLAAVGVLILLWVHQREATRAAEDKLLEQKAAAEKTATETRLEAQGVSVSHAVEIQKLEADRDAALKDSQAFAAELARVQEALQGAQAKITVLQKGNTGVFTVGGGVPTTSTTPAPATGTAGLPPPLSVPAPVCRLAEGDQAEIRTTQATMELKGGVLALAATAELDRILKDRVEVIWSGPLRLESEYVPPPPPPPIPKYGLGARGQCTQAGCAAGLAAAYQPYRHLEIAGDVSFLGAKDAKAVGVSALFRF